MEDDQDQVKITLYRGNGRRTSACHALGCYEVQGIAPAKAREPRIEVSFHVSVAHGIHIWARNAADCEQMPIHRLGPNPDPVRE